MNHMLAKTMVGLLLVAGAQLRGGENDTPTPESVIAIGTKVADWQIANHGKVKKFLKNPSQAPKSSPIDWTDGALYAGMVEFAKITTDGKYHAWLKSIGEKSGWKLAKREYHADDHAVGQFYLSLYEQYKDPKMMAPTKERFDSILANRKMDWKSRWWWCDALFMAPPVWARLAKVTGDKKYLAFMDEEYRATYDLLWDKEECLFFRDSGFFKKTEKNGKKLFWARGNGWVIGGLALMIPELPADWEHREFYVDVFKQMAAKMKAIQRPDGTWSMGLLGDVSDYPVKEASGTAFITFGLAWGINQSILDKAEYEPVVTKVWNALVSCVDNDGMVGYVQPVGSSPGKSSARDTAVYGTGAFLAASAEVYRLVGGVVPATATEVATVPEVKAVSATATEPEAATESQTTTESGPCFARLVPERMDDFAWENDRIAFRMYGPALWKISKEQCGGGIDVWVKRVRYPIIDKWYKSGNYHKDTGEGADLYKVGKTLGCGGVGVWAGDALHLGGHFVTHKVITGSGKSIEFELAYAPVTVGDVSVTEVKRISMTAGSNLFKCQSTFAVKGADSATVAIGVVLRGDKGDLQHGDTWLSYAEPVDGKNGTIFCVVVLSDKGEYKKTKDHGLFLVPVEDGQTVTYHAGAGWSKGLDFKTHDEWLAYVKAQAKENNVGSR